MQKKKKEIIPYPWPVYFTPVVLLVIAGIADSVYLAIAHYRNYTDYTYSSFCALSKAINCDTVAQSPWSVFFGVPLAVWGILGYLLFGIIVFFARKNSTERISLWSLLLLLAFIYALSSLWFGYISAVKIHSYCIMCILSYTVSFSLLFYSFIILRRFTRKKLLGDLGSALKFIKENKYFQISLIVFLVVSVSVKYFMIPYWEYDVPDISTNVSTGVTDDGHPWIGSTHPVLTIEEFTDYQCFQCGKMHFLLRRLISENPEKIKLVHRNYPMDHEFNKIVVPEPFHVGSGRLALLAIASIKQNGFWKLNDALYQITLEKKEKVDIREIAEDLNLQYDLLSQEMYKAENIKQLQTDILQGLKYKMTGTPSYVVNGQVYVGQLPAQILKETLGL